MNATRKKVKLLIELSDTAEEADNSIEEYYSFKTIAEKTAFLKGMFDVRVCGHESDNSDEQSYWAMLQTIINQKYN